MPIAVVTAKYDSRFQLRQPVWDITTVFTASVGSGHDELSETVPVNGILQEIAIVVGSAAGISGTVEVDFDDNNSIEFLANTTLAEGSTTTISLNRPVNNFIIRCDPSAEPIGADETWDITIYTKGI